MTTVVVTDIDYDMAMVLCRLGLIKALMDARSNKWMGVSR